MLSACEAPEDNLTRISKHNGSSHNSGQDCTQTGCHDDKSNIRFSYAGTVYEFDNTGGTPNIPIANADIHFVSFTSSGLVADATIDSTIEVDGGGNFYSTEPLSINYPVQVPCMVPPGSNNYFCMPHSLTIDITGKSCSNASCHLNNRINSDANYNCTLTTCPYP